MAAAVTAGETSSGVAPMAPDEGGAAAVATMGARGCPGRVANAESEDTPTNWKGGGETMKTTITTTTDRMSHRMQR